MFYFSSSTKGLYYEVMNRTNNKLEEYFHYIIFSQQLNYPPSSWDNAKLLFGRIIEQSQQLNF